MNAVSQSEALALTKAEQKRLADLANLTGRSPRATLRFVLRDGLDAVEEDVRETLQGEAEGDARQVIAHAQVMAEVRAMVGRSAGRRGKKAA